MKYGTITAALAVALNAAALLAAEGLPSQSKLNQMGLSSLAVSQDQDGLQIRGKGFVKVIFNFKAEAGEKGTFLNGQFVSASPGDFIANATQSGAGIASDGQPLGYTKAAPQVASIAAQAMHEQDFIDANGSLIAEISSSASNGLVFAGDAIKLGFGPAPAH